jgi:DNA-binding NarL/FixJ family response regulator
MGKIINILITTQNDEDRKYFLAAMAKEKDFKIIGVENDETGAIIKSERLKPNILILDLHPSGMDGLELAPIIHRRSPDTFIIMICSKDENYYAGMALRAGISGILLRDTDMNKLLSVIRIVNLGGYYFSSSIIVRTLKTIILFNQFPGYFTEKDRCLPFSSTERNIITGIANGFSDKEIAVNLNFSEGTIKNYLTAIKRRIKLKNRIQIVIFSLIYGLIDLEQLGFRDKQA